MAPLWLVTGASVGFGFHICLKALAAGQQVIGTVRSKERAHEAVAAIEKAGGHVIELDNTWGLDRIRKTVQDAAKSYGEIDVLVNNAGGPITSSLENFTEEMSRKQMEINFFGPLFTIQAVLPSMRKRRSGTIINLTSASGQVSVPSGALYSASKFALEGATEGLLAETAEFGITSLIVQPGAFRTNFFGGMINGGELDDDYKTGSVGKTLAVFDQSHGKQSGDPAKAADRIVELVTGEGIGGKLKGKVLRVPLGPDCFKMLDGKTQKLREDVLLSREVAESTDF
ncbi:short chain dehydrogenase domain-containing protein [Sarocladium implicatum]|nr:short chain dehydrogenase domain-containing protein [Sarocladium implicatum]